MSTIHDNEKTLQQINVPDVHELNIVVVMYISNTRALLVSVT